MKILNILKAIATGLQTSVKRFPVSVAVSAATGAILVIMREIELNSGTVNLDQLRRLCLIFAMGIPVSLVIHLLSERLRRYCSGSSSLKELQPTGEAVDISVHTLPASGQPSLKARTNYPEIPVRIALWALSIAFLIFYYFVLLKDLSMKSGTRYVAVSMALYLCFFIVPYFLRREKFELYVVRIVTRFFITGLYAGVLFGGMAAILFTVDRLLGVHIENRMYYYVWLAVAFIFAPNYLFAGIPALNHEMEDTDYPKLLRILLLYIVMPLIVAYLSILYIYFAKVLITFEWPVGLVAHLVLWFSVICTAVLFLVSGFKEKDKWVNLFSFWLIKLIFPILIIMFISMGIRVNAYGITENRYFVMIIGIWIAGVFIWLNLAKRQRNIVLPISLAIITVLSVTGPWSAYSVSKLSQNLRLKGILEKYSMLGDDKIVRPVKPTIIIEENDKKEISRILWYFSNSHKLNDIPYLPLGFTTEKMESVFGFSYDNSGPVMEPDGNFSYYAFAMEKPIDIKGYDMLFDFRNYPPATELKKSGLEARYNPQGTILRLYMDGQELYSRNLTSDVKKYRALLKRNDPKGVQREGNDSKMKLEPIVFEDQTNNLKIRFVAFNIYGREDINTGEITLHGIEFYLLVKVK